jgi:hypothetical protein
MKPITTKISHALNVVRKFYPNVEEVIDAKEPIEIEVTKRDSNSAAVKNHKQCAFAVACKRKSHADGVIISIATAYIIKDKTATRYKVPPSVSREIVSFDRQAGFAEGEYRLVPCTKAQRLGAERGSHISSKNGRKIRRSHITDNIRESLLK